MNAEQLLMPLTQLHTSLGQTPIADPRLVNCQEAITRFLEGEKEDPLFFDFTTQIHSVADQIATLPPTLWRPLLTGTLPSATEQGYLFLAAAYSRVFEAREQIATDPLARAQVEPFLRGLYTALETSDLTGEQLQSLIDETAQRLTQAPFDVFFSATPMKLLQLAELAYPTENEVQQLMDREFPELFLIDGGGNRESPFHHKVVGLLRLLMGKTPEGLFKGAQKRHQTLNEAAQSLSQKLTHLKNEMDDRWRAGEAPALLLRETDRRVLELYRPHRKAIVELMILLKKPLSKAVEHLPEFAGEASPRAAIWRTLVLRGSQDKIRAGAFGIIGKMRETLSKKPSGVDAALAPLFHELEAYYWNQRDELRSRRSVASEAGDRLSDTVRRWGELGAVMEEEALGVSIPQLDLTPLHRRLLWWQLQAQKPNQPMESVQRLAKDLLVMGFDQPTAALAAESLWLEVYEKNRVSDLTGALLRLPEIATLTPTRGEGFEMGPLIGALGDPAFLNQWATLIDRIPALLHRFEALDLQAKEFEQLKNSLLQQIVSSAMRGARPSKEALHDPVVGWYLRHRGAILLTIGNEPIDSAPAAQPAESDESLIDRHPVFSKAFEASVEAQTAASSIERQFPEIRLLAPHTVVRGNFPHFNRGDRNYQTYAQMDHLLMICSHILAWSPRFQDASTPVQGLIDQLRMTSSMAYMTFQMGKVDPSLLIGPYQSIRQPLLEEGLKALLLLAPTYPDELKKMLLDMSQGKPLPAQSPLGQLLHKYYKKHGLPKGRT